MRRQIDEVLHYFAQFSYAPTLAELHMFIRKQASLEALQAALSKLIKERRVGKKSSGRQDKLIRYTLPEYSTPSFWRTQNFKFQISNSKLKKIQPYIRLLSKFSQIKLIGLSGSVAMMSAGKGDDIDLFIITAPGRLWTGRFIAKVICYLLRVNRSYGAKKVRDKICLNLLFDERGMAIPRRKRTIYVGHELLQMKPLLAHENAYSRLLASNSWVFDLFPNAKSLRRGSNSLVDATGPASAQPQSRSRSLVSLGRPALRHPLHMVGSGIENILKKLQLVLINRHRTTEIITDTQLWFFPDDFGGRLESP